jgi:aconitate hydratase
VITRSFERIHRSNLVGMGVLPLQFLGSDSAHRSASRATRRSRSRAWTTSIPQQELTLSISYRDGTKKGHQGESRIDTAIEVDYYKHGGILPTCCAS